MSNKKEEHIGKGKSRKPLKTPKELIAKSTKETNKNTTKKGKMKKKRETNEENVTKRKN